MDLIVPLVMLVGIIAIGILPNYVMRRIGLRRPLRIILASLIGLASVKPVWNAIIWVDIYSEASKFAPDPTYNPFDDPLIQTHPNHATEVAASRSARETRYIIQRWAQQ
jgi:hypothetical protein